MANRLSALSVFQTELDIARQRYAETSAAYQTARIDIETQRSYVVAFLKPIAAQESTYPRRWLEWLLVVAPSLFLWGSSVPQSPSKSAIHGNINAPPVGGVRMATLT